MKKNLFIALFLITTINLFAQLSDGLILNYHLDGDALDNSSLMNNGILNNTLPTNDQNDNINSALLFGGNSALLLPDSPNLKPQLPVTLSFIVKLESLGKVQPIYHSDLVPYDYAGFFVNIASTGQVMAHIGGNLGNTSPGNRRSFLSNDVIAVGRWNRVIVRINSFDDMQIYINCYESPGTYSGSGSTTIAYSAEQGRIGEGKANQNHPNGFYLNGALDEISLWSRALTISEISQICNGALSNEVSVTGNSAGIRIYPNPTASFFRITLDEMNSPKKMKYILTNSIGQVVKSNDITENDSSVNVEGLKKGVYNISIFDQENIIFNSQIMIN